jgi:type VI secretion system secreted protein Hcp
MHLRTRSIVAATAAAFAFAALPASAAVDYFLKLDGIDGESTTKGFEKQIEIQSWSWGVSQAATGSARQPGKSCPSDVHFAKFSDKATPPLIGAAMGGTVTPNAILIGLRPPDGSGAPQVYIKYEMKNVMITSFQTGGSSGGGIATDNFSLSFTSAIVTYFTQRSDGSTEPVKATLQGC